VARGWEGGGRSRQSNLKVQHYPSQPRALSHAPLLYDTWGLLLPISLLWLEYPHKGNVGTYEVDISLSDMNETSRQGQGMVKRGVGDLGSNSCRSRPVEQVQSCLDFMHMHPYIQHHSLQVLNMRINS